MDGVMHAPRVFFDLFQLYVEEAEKHKREAMMMVSKIASLGGVTRVRVRVKRVVGWSGVVVVDADPPFLLPYSSFLLTSCHFS